MAKAKAAIGGIELGRADPQIRQDAVKALRGGKVGKVGVMKGQTLIIGCQAGLSRSDRLLIRDCLSFPELGASYFRVAVRNSLENERLLTALTQNMGV